MNFVRINMSCAFFCVGEMEVKRMSGILFLIIFSGTFFTAYAAAEDRPLVFGGTSFPPFFGKHMENNGPLIEIVREAFAVSNRKVIVKWFPWKRTISNAKDGDTDGIAFAWHTKEREAFLSFGEAILPNEVGLFKNKKSTLPELKDFSALKGKVIGFVRGYAVPDELLNSGAKLHEMSKDIQLLRMLSASRIDFAYTDKHVGKYLMLTQAPELQEDIEWFFTAKKYPNYLAISKQIKDGDPEHILQQYAKGLKVIKASGLYDQILKKYQLK